MKLIELIKNEMMAIAESDIRSDFNNESGAILKDKVKNLLKNSDEDDFDPEKLLTEIQNDEQLCLLKSFRWHAEKLAGFDPSEESIDALLSYKYVETEINNFSELIKTQPGNKLLPLLWIIYKMESFVLSEPGDKDILSLYEIVFEKFGYLVELENFFSTTNLLYKSYLVDKNRGDYFIPLFKMAVERYPEKPVLKLSLARFLYDNHDYNVSIEVLKSLCDQIESIRISPDKGPQDSLYEDDYMYAKQSLAKNYDKLGDTEMVQHYADQVINYFHESGGEDNLSYIDSFFLRMRINLNKGEDQKVMEDYQVIKSCLDLTPEYWQENYGDVLKFVEKDGNQQN
jgi:hypothetical protein